MAGYGDAFEIYRKLGWSGILALRAYTKDPPPDGYTGHDGRDPSYADMHAWSQDRPDGNLALRLSSDVVGIDVDNDGKKTGAKTLAEAEKRWGALPPTYRSTSRDDGVSGIRLFKVAPGTVLRGKLEFDELGLGGIEIIQRHHRYVMSWPSHHDKTKLPYRWFDEAAGLVVMDKPPAPTDLPDLSPTWIKNLSVNGSDPVDPGGEAYDVNLAFTAGEPSGKVAKRLTKALAEAAGQNRHDDTRDNVLALLRHGKNGEAGVKMALVAVRAMFISTVTADRSRTEHEASEEFKRFVYGERAAKLLGAKEADPGSIAAFFQFGGTAAVAAAGVQAAGSSDKPRVWWANDLKPAVQPRWLARNRIPRGAVSLLIGDEGIGKSLLWVLIAANITTGKPLPEFGIPARAPGHVMVAAVTEDDWQTVVLPRLIVAGADTSRIRVICTDDDGSGAPTFPRDMKLITEADPKPDLVVVDAWLDTVPAGLQVKDTQQARLALHPWKEAATTLDAGLLLLCHTNRVGSANARDKYGATVVLRQKARMTLFAQQDKDGQLVVGPEKANSAAAANATMFTIDKVAHFTPTVDDDGIVPVLRCAGESNQTARQHLAENYAASGEPDKGSDAIGWLAIFLAKGPKWAGTEIYPAAEQAGYSKDKLRTAKKKLNVSVRRVGTNGPWFWALPQHPDGIPDGTSTPSVPTCPSGKDFFFPGGTSTSKDSQRGDGERREGTEPSGNGPPEGPSDFTEPRSAPTAGPGRCPECGWHTETQCHAPHCQQTTEEEPAP